jgi:hypothetical protein
MKFAVIEHAQNGKRHGPHVNQFSVNTASALFAVIRRYRKNALSRMQPFGNKPGADF